jgi:hypothetical protein
MNKKQKQMIGIGAAVLIVVVILVAVFSGGSNSYGLPALSTLSEKEKYAMFEAEVACKLMESMQDIEDSEDVSGFIQGTLQVLDDVNERYGYTISEIEANKMKYATDTEFQNLARDYAFRICPEIANELSMSS